MDGKRYRAYVTEQGDHWVNVGELVDVGTQACIRCNDLLHANLDGWRLTEAEARRDAADQIDRLAVGMHERATALRLRFSENTAAPGRRGCVV